MEDLLSRFDSRQLKLMGGCAVVLIIAALFAYGVWPQVQELRALRDSHAVLSQVNATPEGAQGEIARMTGTIEESRKRLQGDMANLPIRQMEAFILGRLQTISWRNDVALIGVEPAVGQSVEMYREVLFRVELSGDYFSLLHWLEDVASELGFVVIKEYQLNVAASDPQDPVLRTKLLLAAYRVMDS